MRLEPVGDNPRNEVLAREHRLDQLVESCRDDQRVVLRDELRKTRPDDDGVEQPREHLVERRRDGRHLGPDAKPTLDDGGRVRVDDWEMATDVQTDVMRTWSEVNSENLFAITDYAGFKQEFRNLFGFEVPGVDYSQPVDVDIPLR